MRRRNGFTLIELMIVVAIIGVLAALAVYGVSRYLRNAKTPEATRSLGSIENGQRQQFQRETQWPPWSSTSDKYEHVFCPAAPLTPTVIPKATRITVPTTDWNHEGWACVKFALNDPQYYSYEIKVNGMTGTSARYTATAQSDLDGDGNTSLYELVGRGGPLGDALRDNFRVVKGEE